MTLNDDLIKACKETTDPAKIKALLDSGADASYSKKVEGTWGAYTEESAIHHALRQQKPSMEIIQMLLEKGAKVNAKYSDYNWKGSGSTETAFQMALERALRKDNPELLSLFLKYGGDPNTKGVSEAHTMRYDGRKEWYPIHTCAETGNLACLETLLNAGANINAYDSDRGQSEYGSGSDDKRTALHIACAKGHADIVKTLLKRGAEVNAIAHKLENVKVQVDSPTDDPRDDGYVSSVRLVPVKQTALHLAIMKNHPTIVAMLMAYGADPEIPRMTRNSAQPTIELATSEEVKKIIVSGWTPDSHKYYPDSFKTLIKTLLLCAKKQKWNLTRDTLHLIFKAIATVFVEEIRVQSRKKKEQEQPPTKKLPNLFDSDEDDEDDVYN